MTSSANPELGKRVLVASLCGTYLKPEMQSLYRQITGLQEHRNIVLAEKVANLEMFPCADLVQMQKQARSRPRGNFLLRFWYKHIVKRWPPPRPIGSAGRDNEYYHPYNLVDLLDEHKPDLVHCYYGHKAVKYLKMLQAAGVPWSDKRGNQAAQNIREVTNTTCAGQRNSAPIYSNACLPISAH